MLGEQQQDADIDQASYAGDGEGPEIVAGNVVHKAALPSAQSHAEPTEHSNDGH